MGGSHDDERDPEWGNWVARWTFNSTLVLAILFVGTVFYYCMR